LAIQDAFVTKIGEGDDFDNDWMSDIDDNCPFVYNPDQEDTDGDLLGDICDECTDVDNVGFGDPGFPINTCVEDNCQFIYNPDQENGDGDDLGDACDTCCISPSVGDLDQSGGSPGFNYTGGDLDMMIKAMFIYNDWTGICLDEADVDFTCGRPCDSSGHNNWLYLTGGDLDKLIKALYVTPDQHLEACDGSPGP